MYISLGGDFMRTRLEDFSFYKGNYDIQSKDIAVYFDYHELNNDEFKIYVNVVVGKEGDDFNFLVKMILIADCVVNKDYFEDEFVEDVFVDFARVIASLECFKTAGKNKE